MTINERAFQRRQGWIIDGMCSHCGKRRPAEGRFLCERCLSVSRQYKQRRKKQDAARDHMNYYNRCKRLGRCPDCGGNAVVGYVRCVDCMQKARSYMAVTRQNKRIKEAM